MIHRLFVRIAILAGLLVLVAAAVGGQPFNSTRIFNAGLNLGWLCQEAESGMFYEHWTNYARNGAAEYNNAFFPSPLLPAPPATMRGAQEAIAKIGQLLPANGHGAAHPLFMGGVSLAMAHISAQSGRSPAGLRAHLRSAGPLLSETGSSLNNPKLKGIGLSLLHDAESVIRVDQPVDIPAMTNLTADYMRKAWAVL